MGFSRRELLRRAGLLGVASLLPTFTACKTPGAEDSGETGESGSESETGDEGDGLPEYEWEGELGPEDCFAHGVASGDPLADSVILWSQVHPAEGGPVESFFELALDPEFGERIAAAYIPATDELRDHTIKIDVDGLEPGTTYYYRFYALGRVSPIGRTRTASAGEDVAHLRFGVVSCASWAHGYFHIYDELGGRADLDAVIHLGDYIYEFADGEYGDLRQLDPPYELLTLDDYRRRYRLYRSSPGLQEVHRQHPMIATWDDHEIANDGWTGGAANHDDAQEGPWSERREAATQAYFEYLPIREGMEGRVYRAMPYGGLVDLIVLDTRFEGRDEQVNLFSDPDPLVAIADPERQMLGEEQETWLFDRLSSSSAQWILLAQQVMIGQTIITQGEGDEPNRPLFSDPWDGYEGARRRLLEFVEGEGITNMVVLTGDVHSGIVNELTLDPRFDYTPGTSGSLGVEFVTPSVTSPGLGLDEATLQVILNANPHWRWVDVASRGYMTIDVVPERVQVDYWVFSGGQIVQAAFSGSTHGSSWKVDAGSTVALAVDAPAPEREDVPPLAP